MKKERTEQQVGIGLSGGTDSTAAALLLLEDGYDVVGYTMLTTDDSAAVAAKAAAVADKLGNSNAMSWMRWWMAMPMV